MLTNFPVEQGFWKIETILVTAKGQFYQRKMITNYTDTMNNLASIPADADYCKIRTAGWVQAA